MALGSDGAAALLNWVSCAYLREAAGGINERRMKRSKTNAESMQKIIKKTQSYKEVWSP